MDVYNPTPPRRTRTGHKRTSSLTVWQGFWKLHTLGGILFDDLDLISPRMQGAILITVSKVDCFFSELRRQEKGCLHAQRIKDILLAVYEPSADVGSCKVNHVPELFQGFPRYLLHKESGSISTPAVDDYSHSDNELIRWIRRERLAVCSRFEFQRQSGKFTLVECSNMNSKLVKKIALLLQLGRIRMLDHQNDAFPLKNILHPFPKG